MDVFIKCTNMIKDVIYDKEVKMVLPDPVDPNLVEIWKPYIRILKREISKLPQDVQMRMERSRPLIANKDSQNYKEMAYNLMKAFKLADVDMDKKLRRDEYY